VSIRLCRKRQTAICCTVRKPSLTAIARFIIIFAYCFGAYEIPYLLGATEPKALPVRAYVEYVYPDLAHRPYSMVLNSVMVMFAVMFSYFYYKLQNSLLKKGRGK
jgi:putative spermidine/putrescine transport system permease protein